MAASVAEAWNVDGKVFQIPTTYFLGLPEGLQFTIEYAVPGDFSFEGITDERALNLALPLMRHAYQKKLYTRAVIRKTGSGQAQVSRIGVALYRQSGARTQGYRVARSLAELERLTAQ